MYLFFDTETSGLPRNWKAPVSDSRNWPRLVQLGWIACSRDGDITDSQEFIIRPDGFRIPAGAVQTHGITTERALEEGVPLRGVLEAFCAAVDAALVLVAHNMNFDENILGAEFYREELSPPGGTQTRCCTMRRSTDYCQLPGKYGYKWPTLEELHRKLFGESFENAHGALADTTACMRCFFKLKELGVL